MKYLKLFEKFNEFDPFDPFGEEFHYENKEFNFIYVTESNKICFMRKKNNSLFRLVLWNHGEFIRNIREEIYRFIDYGKWENFRPINIKPLRKNTIKRIIADKIEIKISVWDTKRITFSKLLKILNLKLEDITFLDENNIKKFI